MSETLLQVVGRMHPMLLHLPIGVIAAVVVLELWGRVRKRPPERGMRVPLAWLLFVTAGVSVGTGLVLSEEPSYVAEVIDVHKWLGIVTASVLLVAAALATLEFERGYLAALFMAAVLIIPTGHLGAGMTHGAGFLTAPLAQRSQEARSSRQVPAAGAEPTWYSAEIAPILAAHCTTCHGETRRKGGLSLHNAAAVRQGLTDLAEPVRRIRLPRGDPDHMPPEGKPQPSSAQVEMLARWFEAGAPFGGPEPAAPRIVATPAPIPPRVLDHAAVAALRAAHVHVEIIDPAHDLLLVDFTAMPGMDPAEIVRLLKPLAPHTSELSLRGIAAANRVLVACAPWDRLRRLDLSETGLEREGLAAAAAGGLLEELTLIGADVDEGAASDLDGLDTLRDLHVWKSGIPDEVLARLRGSRPALRINEGSVAVPEPLEVEPEVTLGAPAATASLTPVNRTCPVSGEAVKDKFSIVHEGRVVAFCCEVCAGRFWADPAAFTVKADRAVE